MLNGSPGSTTLSAGFALAPASAGAAAGFGRAASTGASSIFLRSSLTDASTTPDIPRRAL